jgi:glycosyltransferase involved in cell wall biosynthesis
VRACGHGTRRVRDGDIRVAAVGQDGRRVVAAGDVDLLTAVASRSRLSLYDPGPLRYELGALPRVRCISRAETSREELVGQADVYLHRPLPWWAEDCGRTLFAAMARGVPVLCHRDSIYAEYVDDGVDGWIYDDAATAAAALDALRGDPSRTAAAGKAARAKALRLFEPQALSRAYVGIVETWRNRA